MGRHLTVHGFQFRQDVIDANAQNQVLSAAMARCYMRDVYVLFEQPEDSYYYGYPAMEEAVLFTRARTVRTCLEPFGHAMLKGTTMNTTMSPTTTTPTITTVTTCPTTQSKRMTTRLTT